MIHVIATIELQPGARPAVEELFRGLAPLVRAEAGCLAYELAVDVESGSASQGPVRPDTLTVVERWRDLGALQAHFTAPHMAGWKAGIGPLRRSLKLQVLEPVG